MSDKDKVDEETTGVDVGDTIELERSLRLAEMWRQKRTYKMQLTKQYTRLVRLINQELVDREALLQGLEEYKVKRNQILEIIENLIETHMKTSDHNAIQKLNDELVCVSNEADKGIAAVKVCLSTTFKRPGISSEQESENISERKNMNRVFEADVKTTFKSDQKLERISIPKFDGDKTKFEYFWAAFTTIGDDSSEPPKYKMIRLKSILVGKAAEAVEKLGYSQEAYEEAKKTLPRKFGGRRRQIQNYLDVMRKMNPVQESNIEDLEKFTDHLVNSIVMLKEQARWSELESDSMLYSLTLEKLPRTMLSRYFCWLSERHREDNLESLKEWMVDEVEYRVRAVESKDGLSSAIVKKVGNRTTFASDKVESPISCVGDSVPGHRLPECPKFKASTVEQRWLIAKQKKLCFRCVGGRHQGKNCAFSKVCNIDSCAKSHHPLLHSQEFGKKDKEAKDDCNTKRSLQVFPEDSHETGPRSEKVMGLQSFTTTLTSVDKPEEVCSFRTVPVWLKANGKKLRVNAVLDDASSSSSSCMNEDVAILGLRLTSSVVKILGLSMSEVRFWSDSMNVLCWVRGRGRQFRTFVANRIGEIQNLTDPEQ